MGTTMNKAAYQRLIDEDIEWLLKQPRTLERDHIEGIVKRSPMLEYDLRAEIERLTKRAAISNRRPMSVAKIAARIHYVVSMFKFPNWGDLAKDCAQIVQEEEIDVIATQLAELRAEIERLKEEIETYCSCRFDEGKLIADWECNLHKAQRAVMDGMAEVLRQLKDLLEFHEGSAKPEFEGAEPTIRVNGEDWSAALAQATAALAAYTEATKR